MKTKVIIFLSMLLILPMITNGQESSSLAKVGNKNITPEEFELRYKFTPAIHGEKNKSEKELKEEFLYSLIAEKLWALEAKELNLDSSELLQSTFEIIKKMYLRDALYQNEIKKRVRISGEEFNQAVRMATTSLYVKYIVSFDKNEIEKIYKKLFAGASFEEILSKREENQLQKDYTVINFGETDFEVQQALYKLNPMEITKPIFKSGGWFIFKLYEKRAREFRNEKEKKNELSKVRGILEQQKEESLVKEFYKKLLSGKRINSDGYLFWSMSNAVIKALNKNKSANNIPDGKKVALTNPDYDFITNEIGSDSLNMDFIFLDDQKIKLIDFVRSLIFEGFYTNSLDPNIIRAKLKARVKRFIELEVIAGEAKRRGYENSDEVKVNFNIWKDKYLADIYKSRVFNQIKISDEELKEYYRSKEGNHFRKIKLFRFYTDSLELLNNFFAELEKKESFEAVGKMFASLSDKSKFTETEYFTPTPDDPLFSITIDMKKNDIYGPYELGTGYEVVQLVDVKKDTTELKNFENVKANLLKRLKFEKANKNLIETTAKLANKFGLSINENALESISAKNLQMLVYKYFGFGGRMLAYPITTKFPDWIKAWKHTESIP